ncbi:acyltransferase family protein [Streptomyces sp. TRM 70361]|uniref:acyltransferase family protein n=1 Tax=Streptomyces sp. TRM 70361 TaxID=3116553 RepID=UPI002E7C4A8F|nr:acyltransferase family protein [Streptomyces sp. TRM 70361]MEE1938146.1 acyltransferase family protein [Streptomyces sp. TRM 70361]
MTSPSHGRAHPPTAAGGTGEPVPDASAPAAGHREDTGSRSRDAFLDNAKYLALVLVAVAHAWEPLRDTSRATEGLYRFVYVFHMPAFIIISGYLSRSFEGRPNQLRRLVTGVIVPYLIFETAFTLVMRWADTPDKSFTVLNPNYALWFLIALFIWRLTTPLWKLLRHPLAVSLVIAALASATPNIGGDLNLQRVLQFLPYFVLGLQLRPEHLGTVRHRTVRLLAAPVAAVALAVAYWSVPRVERNWVFRGAGAQELGAPWWSGPVMTGLLFGAAVVLTACFLAWVPSHRTWFTALGAGTMYGYLLHVYPVQLSRVWDWYEPGWVDSPAGRIVVTLAAAATVTALCTPPVRHVFRFAVEPRAQWLFRQDAAAAARRRLAAERPAREEELVRAAR